MLVLLSTGSDSDPLDVLLPRGSLPPAKHHGKEAPVDFLLGKILN